MIRDGLEYLFSQAKAFADKSNAKKVELPGDGRTVVIEHNGQLIDRDVPPPLRAHKVSTLNSLIAAGARWNAKPVVWVSNSHVTLIPDDDDRRESVTLKLEYSALFNRIIALAASPSLDQAACIGLLRREFRKAIGAMDMLTSVRKIKFSKREGGFATVEHGNESMGQTIENEVSGASDLPQLLVVPSMVFLNGSPEEKAFEFGLDLELVPANQRFLLRPMPDDIQAAIELAIDAVVSKVKSSLPDVAVFAGSP